MNTVAQNLSHEQRDTSVQKSLHAIKEAIKTKGDLPHVSIKKQLEIVDQLTEFELGRFLIERGGLNGYWTHYIITHPENGRITHRNSHGQPFHPFEAFLLDSAPSCLATQQRFALFKSHNQPLIREGCSFASLPSGLMADLLDLDYSKVATFTLHGIDLDPETLSQAKKYAKEKGLLEHCQFSEIDAWKLEMNEQFDLISSNGLAIYEPDDEKVISLYRIFYNSLKPHGTLITSFLTPPPVPGCQTEWNLDHINPQHALLQKIIFADILNVKWQVYRNESTVKNQLHKAGFKDISVLYDDAHIFPTIVAKKEVSASLT